MNTPTIEEIFVDGRWNVHNSIMTKDFQIVTVSTVQLESPMVDRVMDRFASPEMQKVLKRVKQYQKNQGVYETMVFDNLSGKLSPLDQDRYFNLEAAREGHQLMIERWVGRGIRFKANVRTPRELG